MVLLLQSAVVSYRQVCGGLESTSDPWSLGFRIPLRIVVRRCPDTAPNSLACWHLRLLHELDALSDGACRVNYREPLYSQILLLKWKVNSGLIYQPCNR